MNNLQIATSSTIIIILAVKILLIPSYRSTDFDVHRNWLSITRHLPLSQWYFDDVNGTTIHTLDYPPTFAFFEFFLANNPFSNWIFSDDGIVGDDCLALLGDKDNSVTMGCVIFQRCTVILSDVFFLIGAYAMAVVMHNDGKKVSLAFILTISNSGLLLLDHIHFQYNGALLGILLVSLAALLKSFDKKQPMLEVFGAIMFALLLTLKHLYLILAPLYFVFLLRRFCFPANRGRGSGGLSGVVIAGQVEGVRFSPTRLAILGLIVIITISTPFFPFLMEKNGKEQLIQILSRLFPFQRGLTHDYWAGNMWAIYLLLEKVSGTILKSRKFIFGRNSALDALMHIFENLVPMPFPMITPLITAILLFIGLMPALFCAWKVGTNMKGLEKSEQKEALLYCVVYSSITSFMLAWHVHEKAIMTAIIPCTFLAFCSVEGGRLFLRLSSLGHLGLMPLIFHPKELLVKILLNLSYFALSIFILEIAHAETIKSQKFQLLEMGDKVGLCVIIVVTIYTEIVHPLIFVDQMEFLPLMLVSCVCATGLLLCWIQCFSIMLRKTQRLSRME